MDENISNDSTEAYYDGNLVVSVSDIISEIDTIKRKSELNSFLDDILDTEEVPESTTMFKLLSPDDMGLVKDGYNNMKKFLGEIIDKKKNTMLTTKSTQLSK